MSNASTKPALSLYSRGSEWRRWDLHVHTPETAMGDEYKDWESFYKELQGQQDVRVVGITDYLSIENYTKVLTHKKAKGLGKIELLIPNIEFRIAPITQKGTALNLHLLVDPEDEAHVPKINSALSRLSAVYKDQPYSCTPEQIRNLGGAYNPKLTEDRPKLEEGVNQFKLDFSTFKTWLKDEDWLRRNSLVAISAGEDGPSGVKGEGWGAFREEVWRLADIVFTGNSNNRKYWLCQDDARKADAINMGAPKPCVHGCDAHNLDKLFKPDLERYCWIKADPTFEGLRQILYEPDERVHIGKFAPKEFDDSQVLERLELQGSSSTPKTFPSSPILLNPRMVAIIGPKGSGKSALTDLLSFAGGSWLDDDRSSFLHRARNYVDGVKISATWLNGSKLNAVVGDTPNEASLVRYLSQSFVERLCSEDYRGTELVAEIESVIFNHLDPTDTLNASSFAELREIQSSDTFRERIELSGKIKTLIAEDEQLRGAIKTVPTKKAKIEELDKEQKSLQGQLPKPATPEEAAAQAKANNLRQQLLKVQGTVAGLKQTALKIEQLQNQLSRFRTSFAEFRQDFLRSAAEVGIAQSVLDISFSINGESGITDRKSAVLSEIASLEGKSSEVPKSPNITIAKLGAEIAASDAAIAADEVRKAQIQAIQRKVATNQQEIQRLQTEIARIEKETKERIVSLRQDRLAAYESLFVSWQREQQILEDLYKPVQEKLAKGDKDEKLLDFYIKWQVDVDAWLERGNDLFDQRKTNPFGSANEMRNLVDKLLLPGWTSGDPKKVRAGMEAFLQTLKEKNVEGYLRSSGSHGHLLEWLFDVSHIRLNYGLKYDGTDLDKLSPGTKGIVLLILYLAMDLDDTRPMIVDQPEENLDSESIYSLLSKYFRHAKTRRQVIVITHNPNLVVNTDADQIIIASANRQSGSFPQFSYESGSLENPAIRTRVCNLLEGGARAFMQRERRYALEPGDES